MFQVKRHAGSETDGELATFRPQPYAVFATNGIHVLENFAG